MVESKVPEALNRFLFTLNEQLTQRIQAFVYRYATRRLTGEDVVFLNYGYEEEPAMGVPLSAADEPNRYPIQLYHRTAAQAELKGRNVLEVGCGHGGGASYLMRTFQPASYIGLDLNRDGIEYCRTRHPIPGLEFTQGDAEELPFGDGSFDALVNVESSHLYPRFPRFLDEVVRVLRPGGHFLYTDARSSYDVPGWEQALAESPLRLVSQRDINPEVVRGMGKTLDRWRYVILRVTPRPFRGVVGRFAAEKRAFDGLHEGGTVTYRMFHFVRD